MPFVKPLLVEMFNQTDDVTIIVTDAEGKPNTFVASAATWLTNGHGIWFGTLEEYRKAAGKYRGKG